jgi:threonine-phosphate decarboxylase
MPEPSLAEHGGDLGAIAHRYGVARSELIDFSANINPLGPPRVLLRALARAARDPEALGRYPDAEHCGLRAALARRLAVSPEAIAIGNGGAALLDVAVRVRGIHRCLVPQPSFSENRRALEAAGADIVPFVLDAGRGFALDAGVAIEALDRDACDAIIVTNPHNPSGAVVARCDMLALVHAASARGALAIVDEAFVDYAPEVSTAGVAAREPNTIVLRSLTKFFAVPGLRAGYAICEPALARRMETMLPSWPVTALAAIALTAALGDTRHARRALAQNARERDRLSAALMKLGLRVYPSGANFLLVELPPQSPSAPELVSSLILHDRIVLRDCSSYESLGTRFVRAAVRGRRDNLRLIAALARTLKESRATA